MPQIYFLCTGNSCRSQMAEGFGKTLLGPDWQVASAGIETHGLNPIAVQVMAEKDIDISKQQSQLIDNDYLQSCDLVVTLCGDARDKCPMTPPHIQRIHWPLPDPAAFDGDDEAKLNQFRSVRDQIETAISHLSKQKDGQ